MSNTANGKNQFGSINKDNAIDDSSENVYKRKERKDLLFFAGGMVAFLVIITIVLFSLYNQSKVENMNDVFLVELATGMADKISAIMVESFSSLETSHAAILHHAPDKDAMLDILATISKVSGFDNMYISFYGNTPIDGNKNVLKTHNPLSLRSAENGDVFISNPVTEMETGRQFFTLGTPLYYDNNKIGELYGLYYLDIFASLLDLKTFGGEAFYHLCTVEGIPLVLSGNNDNLFKDGDMYSFIGSLNIQNEHTVDSIRQDMNDKQTALLKYKINNEERTAVMVTVDETDWCVISIILDEVTVQMAQEINQSTLIFSIVMILIFGSFVASSIFHSIQKETVLKTALISTHKMAAKLKTTVETDSLTQVYTRATATEKIREILNELNKENAVHSLIIADVDNFKLINDTYGHQIGDVYLKEFVNAVKQCLRSKDIFGRLGGDEFIVLLNEVDSHDGAQIVANRILQAVKNISIPEVSLEKVGTSIGLVMVPEFGDNYEVLSNMADKALYAAKHAGKSTYKFYEESETEK